MPLAEFPSVSKRMVESGYRPVRMRPYADGPAVKVAAVWARDGRKSRIAFDKTDTAIAEEDGRNQKDGFIPVDVAGYTINNAHGKPLNGFSALWAKRTSSDIDVRMYIMKSVNEETAIEGQFNNAGLIPRTFQVMRAIDGHASYSAIWAKPISEGIAGKGDHDLFEADFAAIRDKRKDKLMLDVAVSEASQPPPTLARVRADLDLAEKTLAAEPKTASARSARASANLRLGEPAKALADFNVLIGEDQDNVGYLSYRAIARARLGMNSEALADLSTLDAKYVPDHSKLFLSAVVSAELNAGKEKAIKELEMAREGQSWGSEMLYESARAFALASKAVAGRDQAQGRRLADRALQLLEETVGKQEADFGRIDNDPALDPIRDAPRFLEVIKAGHPDRRYAAVWTTESGFDCRVIACLDPAEQLRRSKVLAAQAFLPVAWSVARTTPEGPLSTVSLWRRLAEPEEAKDRRAARQARAAVGVCSIGESRIDLAPIAAQPQPTTPFLRRQLDQQSRCRLRSSRQGARPDRCSGTVPRHADESSNGRSPFRS